MHMLDNTEMDWNFPILLLLYTLHLYLHSSAKRRIYSELFRMQMSTPINRAQLRKVQS